MLGEVCVPGLVFDLVSSCGQVHLRRGAVVQRVCVALRVCALFCDLGPGLHLSSWSCWLFFGSLFSWRCARPLSFASFFVFFFLCCWWSVLVLPLSWGPQRSGRASDELRTASSSRICGSVFIWRLERSMLLLMATKNLHSETYSLVVEQYIRHPVERERFRRSVVVPWLQCFYSSGLLAELTRCSWLTG